MNIKIVCRFYIRQGRDIDEIYSVLTSEFSELYFILNEVSILQKKRYVDICWEGNFPRDYVQKYIREDIYDALVNIYSIFPYSFFKNAEIKIYKDNLLYKQSCSNLALSANKKSNFVFSLLKGKHSK